MRRLSLTLAACAGIASCASGPDPITSLGTVPDLPAAAFAPDEPILSPGQLREDLTSLYQGLQEAHFDLYARQTKPAYDRLFDATLNSFDQPLRPSEAVFLFQRFTAFGNIAHARVEGVSAVWSRYREAGGKALPVFPRVRGDRMFVQLSYDPSVAPGDEIIAVNGEPIGPLLQRLYRQISADNAYLAGSLLEFSFPFHLLEDQGPADTISLTLSRGGGASREVAVETINLETLRARTATESDQGDVFVFDASGRKAEMLDDGIAYLQPGPFYGIENPENPWDNSAFKAFIDESFDTFLAEGARALIIDLRQNPGGDNSFSDHMIAWFADEPFRFVSDFQVRSSPQAQASNQARLDLNPDMAGGVSSQLAEGYNATPYGETFSFEIPLTEPRLGVRFEGPVYAIIDRYSYSNAVNVAAILQDYGFATITGEETSDLATSYGAMETFTLPHSGLTVGFPKALIIRPSGDRSDRGVRPDISIPSAPFAAEDVFLQRTLDAVREELGSGPK
ncbi:MAG: S41 family peptidase [Pseudomonadota bacterium]